MRQLLSFVVVGLLVLTACGRPAASAKACTPPRSFWQAPHFNGGLERPHVQVSLDHSNAVYVEGRRVGIPELEKRLRLAASIHNPEVDVFLDTEMGADCHELDAVRDVIDRTMNCRQSGQCAEGSRAVWRNWPVPPGTPPA